MSDPDTRETTDGGTADEEPVTSEASAVSNGDGRADRLIFWGCAVFGLVLATGSVWFFSSRGVWYEAMMRVRPTLSGGGVGASWEAGVTNATLTFLIDFIHFADVVMGIFILLLMLIHWTAFHRLAGRMRPPAGTEAGATAEATATDGGEPQGGDRE
ncbi:hypothetical protein [Halorubrum laminariae]|uniref:Uncharacterized protein n=1 Tax=Halorubrum laminariae TaxID=1433523 RepID=A0ABD6BZX6_9EURY|nr:hypothetical protein [Halorubrum laminariae]